MAKSVAPFSHLKLYRRMVDEKIDEALILEDDVIIHPDFFEIIKRKILFPKIGNSCFLYHGGGPVSFWAKTKTLSTVSMRKICRVAYGGLGYLIRRSAAQKLLSIAYPICVPMDHLTGGGIRTGVRALWRQSTLHAAIIHQRSSFHHHADRDLLRPAPPSSAGMGDCIWFLHNVKKR